MEENVRKRAKEDSAYDTVICQSVEAAAVRINEDAKIRAE